MSKIPTTFHRVATILRFFSAYINLPVFKSFGLKHFRLPSNELIPLEEQLDNFTKWLIKNGLAERHVIENDFIRLHSLYKMKFPSEKLNINEYQHVFIQYYKNYANAINILLQKSDFEQQLLGKKWVSLELENLYSSHLLTLKQYDTTSSFYALATFFQMEQQWERLFHLCQFTLDSMEKYPPSCQDIDFFHQKDVVFNALAAYWEEQKELSKAKKYYEQIIKIYENLDQEYVEGTLYGTILYQGKKRKGEIYNNLGIIAFLENQLNNAIFLFKKAGDIFKKLDDRDSLIKTYNMLATAHNEQKNFEESNQIFLAILNLLDEAEVKNLDQIARVTHNYALHLIEKGDTEHVEFYLLESIDAFAKYNNEEQVASAYLTLGNFYIENAAFSKAIVSLKKMLTLLIGLNSQQKQVEAFQNMGWISAQLEEWEDAESYFSRALQIATRLNNTIKFAELNHNLGSLYFNLKRWKKAEQHFLTALSTYKKYRYHSNEAEVFKNLGMLYLELGNYKEADNIFDNALIYYSNHPKAIDYVECLFYAGMAASKLKLWQKAETYLTKTYSSYYNRNNEIRQAQCLFELGLVEFALKKDQKALGNLNNAYVLFENLQMKKEQEITIKFIRKIQDFLK